MMNDQISNRVSHHELPSLYRLSIEEARGVKRGSASDNESEENIRKWQVICSAPWNVILEGAISKFGPLLLHCKFPREGMRYEHEFCWRDKGTGQIDDRMVFIVHAKRSYLIDGYDFRPGLKIQGTSCQNNWLWATMGTELGNKSLMHCVSCSNDAVFIRNALISFLEPWLKFFEKHFQTL